MFKLSGCFTALITPFKDDKVDFDALRKLVRFQLKSGVSGLVPCGSTGEAASLSEDEYLAVIKTVIEEAKNKVYILAGAGSNSTSHAVDLVKKVAALKPDAILSVAPYYNKPTQAGLAEHYKHIAEAAGKTPVVLYNIPGRTGINITPDTVVKIQKDNKNIAGIKEASGSLDQVTEIIGKADKNFKVISGDDSLTLPMMAVGATGVISVVSNIFPAQTAKMCKLALNGDFKGAAKIHHKLFNVTKALFGETNPIPVKYAASLMGFCTPDLRLPLLSYSKEKREMLKKLISGF